MKKTQLISRFIITAFLLGLSFSNHALANSDESSYLLDAYLKSEVLEHLPKEKFSLLRNEIYATHGYVFKSKKLRAYFQSKKWYKENSDFSPAEISVAEKALIRFIKDLEKSKQSLNQRVIGKWVLNFPFGSGHTETYEFQSAGRFTFSTQESGSNVSGKWKMEGYDLFIKIPNSDWKLICDVRSYNEFWFPQRKKLGYPPRMSIKSIKNRQATNYVNGYFKVPANY